MKTWYQLFWWSLLGRHKTLRQPTQEDFDAFCAKHRDNSRLRALTVIGNVRGYRIDFSMLQTVAGVAELYLEDAISQAQLEQISACRQLTVLDIQHAGKLETLTPLAHLTQLQDLTITIPTGWVGKRKEFADITALAGLTALRYVNLAGIKIMQGGLSPLRGHRKLTSIIATSDYQKEVDELSENSASQQQK